MTLHWRQAITSEVVGFTAASAIEVLLHGTLHGLWLTTAALLGAAVGSARLIDWRRRV